MRLPVKQTVCRRIRDWVRVASDETPSIRSQRKHNEWRASCLAGRLEKQECDDGAPPPCRCAVGGRFYGVLSTSNSHLCAYTQHHVCGWFFVFFLPVCTKSQSGNRTGESPESSFRCLQSWSNTSLNLCTAPMPEIWNWKKEGGNDNMETQKQVLNVEGKIWNQTLKWCHFCQDATLMRHLMRSPPKKVWPFRLWPSPKDRQVFWTAAVKPTTVQSEYSRMRGNLFCGL